METQNVVRPIIGSGEYMNAPLKIVLTVVLLVLITALGNHQPLLRDVEENAATVQADQWRYQTVQNDDWKFEVGIQEKPFVPYETIWLELSATNISDTLLIKPIMKPGEINLELKVFNQDGEQMHPPNIGTFVDYSRWPTIKPGECLRHYLDLRTYNRVPAEIMYLTPGQYYVTVKYKPFSRNSSSGVVHSLDSIRFQFFVLPPRGEEVEAHKLFEKLMDEWKTGEISIPPEFFQLQDEYPDARYTKFAYEILLFRSGRFRDTPKVANQQLAMLRRQYFAKYAGQLWNPEWNKVREVQMMDSSGNWLPK